MIAGLEKPRRALVVFVDRTELKKLRVLKRGYRHCFALIEGSFGWTIYNPLSHYTEIETYPWVEAHEIRQFYENLGHVVLTTEVQKVPKKRAPLFPYTCVEAVKRALGIQSRYIVTPWQLCQFLDNNHNIVK